MWVSDNADDKIYAYSMATKARDPDKDLELDEQHNGEAGGLYGNSDTLWVSDTATDKILAYTITAGSSYGTRDTTKDLDLDADDSLKALVMPTGIWSDNSTMWLIGNVREDIYAYNVGSAGTFGARETAKECSLAPEYSGPNGMWSDGSTIWVADSDEDRIFAYALTSSGCGARQAPPRDHPRAAQQRPLGHLVERQHHVGRRQLRRRAVRLRPAARTQRRRNRRVVRSP